MIFSKGGTFESTSNDPEVKVYMVNNNSGGMTIFLVGKPGALTRNMKNLVYRGSQPSLSFQICVNLKNYGSWTLGLTYS